MKVDGEKVMVVEVWCISAGAIFHCTIMPCYDKKLEAARDDFIFGAESGATEVDCVLTSGEIVELLQERGADLAALEEAPLDRL